MIWNTHTTYKLQQTLPLLRYIYHLFLHLIFVHLICPVGFLKCFVSHKGQVETNPKVLLRSQTICTSSICTMVKIYYFNSIYYTIYIYFLQTISNVIILIEFYLY